jgi:hypothetical protein
MIWRTHPINAVINKMFVPHKCCTNDLEERKFINAAIKWGFEERKSINAVIQWRKNANHQL